MDWILISIAIICGIVGLIGAVVPALPGTIVSYIGVLCAFFIPETSISIIELIIITLVSAIVVIIDYLLPGYCSRVAGGTKAGMWGANIGLIVGIFFGIEGIILGPFIGAVVFELINNKLSFWRIILVGLGAMVSFFIGTGLKLIVGLGIMIYIATTLWNMIV